MHFLEKLFYFTTEFPFTVLRDLSIPCCNEERWNKNIFLMNPIVCTLFILATTNSKFSIINLFKSNNNYFRFLSFNQISFIFTLFNTNFDSINNFSLDKYL